MFKKRLVGWFKSRNRFNQVAIALILVFAVITAGQAGYWKLQTGDNILFPDNTTFLDSANKTVRVEEVQGLNNNTAMNTTTKELPGTWTIGNVTGVNRLESIESVQEHGQFNKSINNTNEEIINTSTKTFKVEFEFADGQWSNGSIFNVWKGEMADGSHGEWWYWASNDSLESWEYVNSSGYRKEGSN